nr:Protein lsd90 like [Ipomoea batatas]GME05728.1 Protein lsd90 like [Ipomoea batatas]GME10955.1 Protein lsd90 like [Ipomoea batatas]
MKFLSELGACWGGATITPPNRAATRHESRRQVRSINATNVVANWKPELHDISEEKVLSDSDLTVKKSSAKIKPSSMSTKVSMLGEGFRKSYRIAMNGFVPSPYMI